jgi:hypothetical protein
VARQRHGSDVRQQALRRYAELLDQGTSISQAQVDIAHNLQVSVATVQRWVRDQRNHQQRESLLPSISPTGPEPDWAHVADDTPQGRAEREAAYLYFGNLLAQFYEIGHNKQPEFAQRFSDDPAGYLEATLQLAALATKTINNAVKTLVLLGSSNDIPSNRLATWSNIPPATLRLWEQEGEKAVDDYNSR